METRINYVLVGLFVILLGAAGIGLSLWLAFGDFAQEYRLYRVYMTESVSGLYVDAPVRYRGVEVGKVRELNLDPANPQRVELLLAVRPDVPIRTDTVATLSVQGLTGIASIELSGGSPEAPPLAATPGEPYPVIPTGPSLFSRLDDTVSELIGNLNVVSRDLHALLNPDNRERIGNILAHVEAVTGTLADNRQQIEKGLAEGAQLLAEARQATAAVPDLLARVEAAAAGLEAMAADFRQTSGELRRQVAQGGQAVSAVTGSLAPELSLLIGELRRLAGDLRRLAGQIEEEPARLLYGNTPEPPGPGE